jgi:hypothetical protein
MASGVGQDVVLSRHTWGWEDDDGGDHNTE